MLPPVRATSSSSAEYQAPNLSQPVRQRIEVVGKTTQAETPPMPLSASRLAVMALSAQLRLTHSFAALAETIGKMIQLPSKPAEALPEYAQRLLDAVKNMNAPERVALERQLNQIVKGVTIRLLTEILNNPTGSEAARLAIKLEVAQLAERDLAAKAVVSSYRQNAGNEQATPLARPTTPIPSANGSQTPTLVPAETAKANVAAGALNVGNAQIRADGKTPTASVSITAPTPNLATARSSDRIEPRQQERPADFAHPNQLAVSDIKPLRPALQSTEKVADSVRIYDAPALVRLSQKTIQQPRAGDVHRSPNVEKLSVSALTEWLAEAFAEDQDVSPSPANLTRRPVIERATLETLTKPDFPTENRANGETAFTEGVMKAVSHPSGEPELDSSPTLPTAAKAATPANSAAQTEIVDQLLLPIVLPHIVREGIPLPFVPYPPEEQEQEKEPRRTHAVSETDEDGEQQQSTGEQDFGDRHQDEDEKDTDASDSQSEPEENRPQDLYWRMAGWN